MSIYIYSNLKPPFSLLHGDKHTFNLHTYIVSNVIYLVDDSAENTPSNELISTKF